MCSACPPYIVLILESCVNWLKVTKAPDGRSQDLILSIRDHTQREVGVSG